MYSTNDKCKVFFESIGPKTKQASLEAYLSREYQIQYCQVNSESDKNKGYATVVFSNVANVDKLMDKRPHKIDDVQVEVYRAISKQKSLKQNKGVKNLIVSGIKDKLSKSDLQIHFEKYGKIHYIEMNGKDNSCQIVFNDYDPVDKAIQDAPHTIQQVKIELEKGPRSLPDTAYFICIKKIPSKISAQRLSVIFEWPVYNIIMCLSENKQSLSECWLKGINNREAAMDFIKNWNEKNIYGSKILCHMEEDTTELCKHFQLGPCSKHDKHVCDWQHVMCSEYETCSKSNCLYGHMKGLKTNMIHNVSNKTYRLKITGFEKELTPKSLAQLLDYPHENRCHINEYQPEIGYIVELKTVKYAERLFQKWHNKEIENGHKLKCQLELDVFPFTDKTGLNQYRARSLSWRRPSSTAESSRDSSLSTYNNDDDATKPDDRKFSPKVRDFSELCEELANHPAFHTERRESVESKTLSVGFKLQLPTDELADKWEVTPKSEEDQVLLLRGKVDRKKLTVIKIYHNKNIKDYSKELKVLTILKDTNNVSQLIEYQSNKIDSWIIMERAPGYSLKEFIEQKHHNDLGILEAVQLVQQLLIIVKRIHSQGVIHNNLEPKHIMIEWDKKTSIEQAHLTVISFSQAFIKSENNDPTNSQSKQNWYRPPQANAEGLQNISSVDASNIGAILFWLITKTAPRHNDGILPYRQDDALYELENKISKAVKTANSIRNEPIAVDQLKKYMYDTFNMVFGFPEYKPMSIDDLEVRVESIRELLLPSNPNLVTVQDCFQELIHIRNTSVPVCPVDTSIRKDIFKKAANAFYEAKTHFLQIHPNRYSWSDGTCSWFDDSYNANNERQHEDTLTYYTSNRNTSCSCSIKIICLANVTDEGNVITLSIGSQVNDIIIRIPIGQYSKAQNYTKEFEDKFVAELKNLIISVCKQEKPQQS